MASAEDAARDRDGADDISVGALIDDLTVRRARGRERAERRDDAPVGRARDRGRDRDARCARAGAEDEGKGDA